MTVINIDEVRKHCRWKMQAKGKTGELFLYDDIGPGFWDDGITAQSFADDLKALGDVTTLMIYINSPGGSVFDGVAIYNQLRRHQARKIVSIDGIAASIASVIAMAGDERSIAGNGILMIHNPWAMAFGEAKDMRKMADSLDTVRDGLLNTYEERSTTPRAEIGEMMDAETWMSPEQALAGGFVDSIGADIEIAAKFDLSKFQHPPDRFAKAETPEEVVPVSSIDESEAPAPAPAPSAPHPKVQAIRRKAMKRRMKSRTEQPAPPAA